MSQQAPTPAGIQAVLAGPAGPPPAGVTSNFTDPPSLAYWNSVSLALFMTVTTLAVAARLLTQWDMQKRLNVEDGFIILAWLSQVGLVPIGVYGSIYGTGKHMWDITLQDFLTTQYYENIATILYAVAVLAIKVAILLQILRVFVPDRRSNRILFLGCYIWIGLVTIFYTINFAAEVAQCIPREKIWNPFLAGGHCLDDQALIESAGLFNVISDVAIFLLPLPTVYRIQCSWKRKLAIGSVFALGLITCIVSIMRTWKTWALFTSQDASWALQQLSYWTWAELCGGTLTFCFPILPRFFNLIQTKAQSYNLTKFWSSREGSTSQGIQLSDSEPVPSREEQPSKQMYPHMVVSLASWEEPGNRDSQMPWGNSVSVSRGLNKSASSASNGVLVSNSHDVSVSRADEGYATKRTGSEEVDIAPMS